MSYPPSLPDGPQDRGPEPTGYPAPNGGYPPRPPSPGARVGRASGVEVRQELQYTGNNATYGMTVLAFRLLEPGNPQPLDVQLRGRTLSGTLREGDWVEVAGPPDATGRWDVTRVQNLTTAATVVAVGGRQGKAALTVLVVLACLILVIIGLVIVGAVASMASG
ncbi:hypothetical protein [Microlunatus antarcticus]